MNSQNDTVANFPPDSARAHCRFAIRLFAHFCTNLAFVGSKLGPASRGLYTRQVKIALGQINPTVGDFSGNAAKIVEYSRRAHAAGAGLILFPELSVCGYPPRDLVERSWFVARNRETVERIAAETRGIAAICGLVTPAGFDTG
jgi:Carbon-nitrogen hydrolase